MSFGREKRLLLGWLAALAPLPLPFNGILEWSFVLAYWMAVAVFLYRAQQGSEDWLPPWALNLIGLVYMPVVYLDFTRFWGGQVLRPLLHLAGFALVVKLFALDKEKEKWHVLIGIYFLFLASMGTSVHPSIVLVPGRLRGALDRHAARASRRCTIWRRSAARRRRSRTRRCVVSSSPALRLTRARRERAVSPATARRHALHRRRRGRGWAAGPIVGIFRCA